MRLMRARMMNMGPQEPGSGSEFPPRRRGARGFPGPGQIPGTGQPRQSQGADGRPSRSPFGPPRGPSRQGTPPAFRRLSQGDDPAALAGRASDPRAFNALFKQAMADPEVRQTFLEEFRQLSPTLRTRRNEGGSGGAPFLATALETLIDPETAELSGAEPSWMEEALEGVFGESPVIDHGAPLHSDQFGPLTQVSSNLRIQAAEGYRAGVIPLKPGMYLVTEVPETALQPEFGVAAVLAPLAISMATKALEDPDTQKALLNATGKTVRATGKGLKAVGHGVKNLFHRDDRRSRRRKPARHQTRRHPQPNPAKPRQPVQLQRMPASERSMSRPLPMRQPYAMQPGQAVVPQGYYAPAYPMGYPAPGTMQVWQPGGGYFPMQGSQMPMNFAQPTAVPWADSEELAGVLEEEDWL